MSKNSCKIELETVFEDQIKSTIFKFSDTFSNDIKKTEAAYPLPNFKSAYSIFCSFDDKVIAQMKEYDTICLMKDQLIEALAKEFVETNLVEKENPMAEFWVLPHEKLDFSVESLKLIDERNQFASSFNQKYCNEYLYPMFFGYVMHTVLKNVSQDGWHVVYGETIYKTKIPAINLVLNDYIKLCFYSGFKLMELYNCIIKNTAHLEGNFKWRRHYLGKESIL